MEDNVHIELSGFEPDDATLLELGRLTWAAIELEDAAYEVCRQVRSHGAYNDRPIGEAIGRALRDLAKDDVEEDLRAATRAWLSEARDSLDVARNQVLHVTPVTWMTLDGKSPVPDTEGGFLHYFSRPDKRTGERAMSATRVSVNGLRPLVSRLRRARQGWPDVAVSLSVTSLDRARARDE